MRQPLLTTPRLTLNPADTTDLPDLHGLWNDPQVRRFLFDDQPVSEQLATTVLQDSLMHSENGYGLWMIHLNETPAVAGCAGLIPTTVAAQLEPRLNGLLEPLAALQPKYWSRGYASEALAALRDYAFTQLGVRELAAVNDVPNLASGRMLLRLGFAELSQVAGPKYELQTYHLRTNA